jgi:hypothetical protein
MGRTGYRSRGETFDGGIDLGDHAVTVLVIDDDPVTA